MSYYAIVCKVTAVFPIEGADRIQRALVLGTSVVVSKATQVGDLGVFFPCDGQLSPEFAKANDLVGKYENGKKVSGGFFSENRRVKAQKFKGIKSEGFFCELSLFNFTGEVKLKEGDKFDSLNGIPICNKYVTPETIKAQNRQQKKRVKFIETMCFKEHFDTAQLRFYANQIPAGALCHMTVKLHGTSQRSGNVLVKYNLPWWKNVINKIRPETFKTRDYRDMIGTRRTILNERGECSFYKDDFRSNVHKKYFAGKLRKGEMVYYEVVGFTTTGAPIMSVHPTKDLKEKSIEKLYGPEMKYSYGLPDGECDAYVYRITNVNEDGHTVDLSWSQVKARCTELGVKYVPEAEAPFFHDGDGIKLLERADKYLNVPSKIDPRHIEEGVCIRIEHGYDINIYKHKSYYFLVLEGVRKEDDSYVDTEEAA